MNPRRADARVETGAPPAGYTLIETLVTVALLVVIAAILAPVIFSSSTAERLGEADGTLKDLTDAVAAFFADVDEWPDNMGQLTNPLTGGQNDICGDNYTGGERNSWAGPYINQVIPAGGLPVGIGTAQSTFGYVAGADYDVLQIIVTGVDETDAIALDDEEDGDSSQNAGTVQWSAPSGGQVTMTWNIPITQC